MPKKDSLEVIFKDSTLFYKILYGIKDLVKVISFKISNDSIKVQYSAYENVVLIIIELTKDLFQNYNYNNEDESFFSCFQVDKTLLAVLKTVKKEDQLRIIFKKEKLQVFIDSSSHYEYSFKCVASDNEIYTVPDIEYEAFVQFDFDYFKEECSKINQLEDENIRICVENDTFCIHLDTESSNNITGKFVFKNFKEKGSTILWNKNIMKANPEKEKFSQVLVKRKLFLEATKIPSLGKWILILIKSDFPLKLTYPLFENIKTKNFLTFHISPNINEQEMPSIEIKKEKEN